MTTVPPVPAPDRQPWRLGQRGQVWFDVALALGLLAPVAAFPVLGLSWGSTALAAAQLLPLFWRRRHPQLVFAAVALASAAQAVAIDNPLWSQVAFPVATYSVARYAPAIRGLLALAVGLCGAAVAAVDWLRGLEADLNAGTVSSYFLTVAMIVVAAWALGTLGRVRRAYVDAVVERSQRVEREATQQVALAQPAGADLADNLAKRSWVDLQLDILTGTVVALLGIAVVIALIGIGNTLGLSVLERGRENALLRALGLTRRQLRATLAAEALLLSVVATVLGTAIGVTFAWVSLQALVKAAVDEAPMVLPWGQLAIVVVLAAVAGLASSLVPARRAARIAPAAGLSLD